MEDGFFSIATALLVSTYIAQERPEGDPLGSWAEIVQALGIVALAVAVVVLVIAAFAAIAGRD